MHTKQFKLLTIACGIAMASIAQLSLADQVYGNKEYVIEGLVVGVHDGDTITVLDKTMAQHKIRLTGIDAPELDQSFGKKSKYSLSDTVYRHQVTVRYEKEDMYGRVLGQVFVDGVDANQKQVDAGMAWAYRTCNKYQICIPNADSAPYISHEATAKHSVLGLWQESDPTPPWSYRKANKH